MVAIPASITRTRSSRRGRLQALCGLVLATGGCEQPHGVEPLFPPDFIERYPEVRTCRYSTEHDSVYIRVHVDPDARQAYVEGRYPFAEGTVIVKREFADAQCTRAIGFTAMQKLSAGSAPEFGDWRWQRTDSSMEVIESGALRHCSSCHASCTAGRDFTCTDP